MKKVSIIGTVGLPASYGGFETLVDNLTKKLSNDFDFWVFCSSKNYKKKKKSVNNASLVYIPLQANGISSIFYDITSMLYDLYKVKSDVLLILGVSGCIFLPVYKIICNKHVIVNIDGLEWRRDKWNSFSRKFLKFSEKMAIRHADEIITDNEAITNYVFEEYGVKSATIAYGGDHAKMGEVIKDTKGEYYLSICRIEPENNVEVILESFSKSHSCLLKFIGNWDNSDYGTRLKEKYKKFANIEIIDPIYDLSVLFEFRENSLGYVHGHSAGGTNPSLVEAMHFGKPIIAYDCSFNRYTTEDKALFFNSSDSLCNILSSIAEFQDSGHTIQEIATRKYTWDIISNLYKKLLNE